MPSCIFENLRIYVSSCPLNKFIKTILLFYSTTASLPQASVPASVPVESAEEHDNISVSSQQPERAETPVSSRPSSAASASSIPSTSTKKRKGEDNSIENQLLNRWDKFDSYLATKKTAPNPHTR